MANETSAGPAAVAETHISVLFFVGDRAYKLKKPVSLGFLDFSTREARLAACRSEVDLNRRLAPDVYLGVADVTGPDGEVCDHLVVMRRMPPERRLTRLVTDGADVDDELRDVARIMATFHAKAERSEAISGAASRDAVAARWEDNFETLAPFAGPVVDPAVTGRVESMVRRYLAGREALFEERVASGAVCDGHGDLQADDIFCLDDGPRLLDCLEFDPGLRHGDVLADVAFLAMDLERLGRPDAAARFLGWYQELSGATWPPTLADLYVAYRAHVRAKVACLRHAQGDPAAADAARLLLDLADRRLRQGRVTLVLVGGAPGTGKSTLAAGLADRLGWPVVRSDVVRKEMAGLAPTRSAAAGLGEGLYRPEVTGAVYAAMAGRARTLLGLGQPVILDASWTDIAWRDEARRIAADTVADIVELRCHVDRHVAAERVRGRAAEGADASDATPEVAAALAARAAPWPEAAVIDTAAPPEEAVDAALDHLQARPPG